MVLGFSRVLFIAAACVALVHLSGRPASLRKSTSEMTTGSNQKSAEAPADLVLTNGRIYTVDAAHPWATAIACRDGIIVVIADSDADVNSFIGPKTRVIDLHGQFAMPGFNDAHVHLAGAGYQKLEVDLEGTASLAEFQQRIRYRLKDYKAGEWMSGRGWDHTLWPVKKFPTRQDLDAVSTDHPMWFGRVDGHVAVVNSAALVLAGITRSTPDPPSGHIERDAAGEPTGMLEEDSAMDLVHDRIPPHSQAQRRRALELVLEEVARYGATSLQDNSIDNKPDADDYGWQNFLVFQQLQREGKLNVHVTEWLPFGAPLERLKEMRAASNPNDPWLKTGQLKAFLDGSLGSRTAAMLASYSDDAATSGILREDAKKLEQMSIERDRAGFQLAFHAIGDRANRLALDVFAAVRAANGPRDRRDRIEHAQIVSPPDIPRFASLGVIPSMQPSHLLDDERWAEDRLGAVRLRGAYAWHSLEASGAHLAFGTDYPVESVNPLRGIYACVTRELPGGGPPGGWHPEEKMKLEECLRAYTVGSAYAQFEEQRKGIIARGMLADVTVFPADLTRLAPKELLLTEVVMTIAGGKIIYEKPK
jgi:predicted amidohydrolase YtcJ